MRPVGLFRLFRLGGVPSLLLWPLLAATAFAGGSGLNTLVVVNQTSSNSCALGNYYCEKRQVPPENLLRIFWSGSVTTWSSNDFQTVLLGPLTNMLALRGLTSQIDYVVLSMDIPFQTTCGNAWNSTTACLFYGVKDQTSGTLLGNTYVASERAFRTFKPSYNQGYSFLATMITGTSLADAKATVDQGVASDGAQPGATVLLAKSSDTLRNVRYSGFDSAIFNACIGGQMKAIRTNMDDPSGLTNLLGFQTGLAGFSISPNTFVPGAMADSMTSYGGLLFDYGQTPCLAFMRAGASGSYGTITEPGADPGKFPSPQNYFYQARGFSLAECYYQSIAVPYEGLVVGEPLAAPFARFATGQWLAPASNAVLSGTAPLSLRFAAADADHPVQQVDLFLDGRFFTTITNVPLQPGNQLQVNLGSNAVVYSVSAQDTLESAASNLVSLLNAPSATNATKAVAAAHGDRIELRSIGGQRVAPPGSPKSNSTSQVTAPAPLQFFTCSAGTAPSQTAWLVPARKTFLNSPSQGFVSCRVAGVIAVGAWVHLDVVKTNGATVSLSVTNQISGASSTDLATQLVNAVSSAVALKGQDGILLEDFATDVYGTPNFKLRARTPGYFAAGISVTFSASSGVYVSPSATTTLMNNLTDLQPRDHLYVRAGVATLDTGVTLDTTALPDGFHELTAVAYEGSNVRTQTRISVPVQIRNSSLNATLTSSDLADGVSVSGTYHIQVNATGGNVSSVSLFSTGGQLGTIANQSDATFVVNGTDLGMGLHPFYAVVQPTAGPAFRTRKLWVRLGP